MAKKAVNAGGTIFGEPSANQGWMYGCGFADLDGHSLECVVYGYEKMPKGEENKNLNFLLSILVKPLF